MSDMTPQIIRTLNDLEALDQDSMLMAHPREGVISERPMLAWEWCEDYEIDSTGIFPLAVIATGEQVRAARQALEKEQA